MSRKKSAAKAAARFSVAEVIAALEVSAGIISAAARKLRCSRTTIRNYITRYPEISAALEQIEEDCLDLAEAGLVQFLGDEKNPALRLRAIEFFLRTKGKYRGFTMGTELTGKEGGAIETKSKVTIDVSKLTPEELAELERHALIAITGQRIQ